MLVPRLRSIFTLRAAQTRHEEGSTGTPSGEHPVVVAGPRGEPYAASTSSRTADGDQVGKRSRCSGEAAISCRNRAVAR